MTPPDRAQFSDRQRSAEFEPEPGYEAAVEALLHPPPFQAGGLVLIGTLALFLLAESSDGASISSVAILVGVLLFHELGHFAGMKVFGYRDVKMFFIPFLGAAVSGQKTGVAAWKEGVVSLLGPLPGIAIGAGMVVVGMFGQSTSPMFRDVAAILIGLNAFNLLPLSALDGGRLFQRILFSRHRLLEVGFQGLTGGLLLYLAFETGSWALGIFAYLIVVTVPRRYKILEKANDLLRIHPDLPADPHALDLERRHALFVGARGVLPERFQGNPTNVAQVMREVLDATRPAPSFVASFLLLGVWGAAVFVSIVAAVGMVATTPPQWAERSCGPISVHLPQASSLSELEEETPRGRRKVRLCSASLGFLEEYHVRTVELGEPLDEEARRAWVEWSIEHVAVDASSVEPKPIVFDGRDAVDFETGDGWLRMHHRSIFGGTSVHELSTTGVRGESVDRFFSSFRLTETSTNPP